MPVGKLKRVSDKIPMQMLKGDRGDSGKDGKDGKDGRDGKAGKDGLSATGIRGERGYDGKDGEQGLPPAHQISNGEIRFQNPDGTWGNWLNIGGQSRPSGGGGGGVFGTEEVTGDSGIDGGRADSVYLPVQLVDGGSSIG